MANTIDITREHCPMTFVKVKLALSKLATGDELIVLLSEGEPLDNVPKSSTEQGHTVLSSEDLGGGIHRIVIRK